MVLRLVAGGGGGHGAEDLLDIVLGGADLGVHHVNDAGQYNENDAEGYGYPGHELAAGADLGQFGAQFALRLYGRGRLRRLRRRRRYWRIVGFRHIHPGLRLKFDICRRQLLNYNSTK